MTNTTYNSAGYDAIKARQADPELRRRYEKQQRVMDRHWRKPVTEGGFEGRWAKGGSSYYSGPQNRFMQDDYRGEGDPLEHYQSMNTGQGLGLARPLSGGSSGPLPEPQGVFGAGPFRQSALPQLMRMRAAMQPMGATTNPSQGFGWMPQGSYPHLPWYQNPSAWGRTFANWMTPR